MARSGSLSLSDTGGAHGRGTVAASRIVFTQIDLQHSKDAMAHFVSHFSKLHTAIAIIQEPWVSYEMIGDSMMRERYGGRRRVVSGFVSLQKGWRLN